MSLVARHLEAQGIATIVVGSARDIVEECGVARFLFVDYPLGNPTGKPDDADDHRFIVSTALDVLESAILPRTTVQAPVHWGNDDWRDAFMPVTDENRAFLMAQGDKRRAAQAAGK
ncbi:hypothetical protein [Ilumatobacter coccineus]|uniref:Uncharacterized protein n=1 Tax=Ilumatobacter coccineus (strain NBRC 103263 / KCTC 29153 / YM16-304) TaxID=1313172 RepID=A0A6C7E8V1_ILUCY|nr:hypothetical protein [Ilumatobacter coccineus]BAN01575.1 hypothetical protein YM304_12610 [Ilumatobacter coccineus YM16-304]